MTFPKTVQILAIIFSVLLGIVFVISALTKLFPVEPFEYTFVELGITGWKSSVIAARLFIGFELACAVLLIGNLWLRKLTIPLVTFILIIFTVYLIVQISSFGNGGNCGCFGDYWQLTPLEGIVKNIVMLLVAVFIYVFHKGFSPQRIKGIAAAAIIVTFAMPFLLNPVDLNAAEHNYSNKLNYKVDLDILYTDEYNEPPRVELRKGKWIIAFMSLKCPHCKRAAKKLHIMKLENPGLPIHLVLNGKQEQLQPFFDETRAGNLSWSVFNGADQFIKMAGVNLPEIVWVNNSIVEHKSSYTLMQQSEIEEWLGEIPAAGNE